MNSLQALFDELPTPPGESVWGYPAVPRIEPCRRSLEVVYSGRFVAATTAGLRVLETGHPPVYYFPLEDVRAEHLQLTHGRTWSAHRGVARYFDLVVDGRRSPLAAWTHPRPAPSHAALAGYVAFYAGRVDAAFVDGEPVIAQPGGLFGGWITTEVVGPYIGGRGVGGAGRRASAQGRLMRTTHAPRGSTPGR